MSVNIRPISDELAKVAREELNEVPERIPDDIKAFKDWIAKQPHIKGRTDDQFLVNFLRGCKFSLERAKEKYDLYYTLRTAVPEFFTNRDPADPKIKEILRLGTTIPLPTTLYPGGPRLYLVRPCHYDSSKFDMWDIMKLNFMFGDILFMEDDNMVISGLGGVLDLSGGSISHFVQMTPTWSKKITMISQEGSPLRIKGFHYINTPKAFEAVFNVFKSFMNEKNRKRLYVYGSKYDALYEHIPKKLLPKEYGGEAGTIDEILDYWEKKFMEYREFFLGDPNYGTDEKKRPGKPKNAESLFGVDGSFRKLVVD